MTTLIDYVDLTGWDLKGVRDYLRRRGGWAPATAHLFTQSRINISDLRAVCTSDDLHDLATELGRHRDNLTEQPPDDPIHHLHDLADQENP